MKFSIIITALSALVAAKPVDDTKSPMTKRWGDRWGKATWFNDKQGACGNKHDTYSEDFVAISETLWNELYQGDSDNAWMCDNHYLRVHYGDKEVRVKVDDYCEGCEKDQVDLSKHAFKKLADWETGEIDVWWYWED